MSAQNQKRISKISGKTMDNFIDSWNVFARKAKKAYCLRDIQDELYDLSDKVTIMVTEMNDTIKNGNKSKNTNVSANPVSARNSHQTQMSKSVPWQTSW